MAKTKKTGPVGGGALSRALGEIRNVLKGDDSPIVEINENAMRESLPHISTGCSVLDIIIGGLPNAQGILPCPGFPRARVINLYGQESSGKTTLCLHLAANTARLGGSTMYIDFENAIDVGYAASLGVPVSDPDRFVLIQPTTLSDCLMALWTGVQNGVDLVIVDSIMSGATKQQWEQDLADKGETGRVGAKAQQWSEYLPQLRALMMRTRSMVVGVSQLRTKIETGPFKSYGDPLTAQGGQAWKFFSDLRIGLKRIGVEKEKRYNPVTGEREEMIVANKVKVSIDKCKVSAAQGRQGIFYVEFGKGVDDLRSLLDIAIHHKIAIQKGSSFSATISGQEVKAVGFQTFKKKMEPHLDALRQIIADKLKGALTVSATTIEDEVEEGDDEVEEILFNQVTGEVIDLE